MTQSDVARQAGVHRASVSMALRNHPNIPATTRDRILRIAAELGYIADPMLSALAAYRIRKRPSTFQGALAWLVDSAHSFNWRARPHFVQYFAGASERAKRYGYKLEVFDLNRPSLTSARIASILKTRGVTGVLLCPQPRAETVLPFPWEQFASLTFGYSLIEPELHTITATHYRATLQTMRELISRGYQRIGIALHSDHDLRTDHNYLAGYLVGQVMEQSLPKLPPLFCRYDDTKAFASWLETSKPDAVISGNYQVLDTVKKLRIKVPQDLGLACPALPSANTRLAGVVENNLRVGAVAVDQLVSMIQRGERGIPVSAERVHVEGYWWEGATLRGAVTA